MPTAPSGSGGGVGGAADNSLSGDGGEGRWKLAYEKVVKENEQLRIRGGDILLATQWKERYDECLREKENLLDTLKIYSRMSEAGNNNSSSGVAHVHTAGGTSVGGKPLEQLYIELKEEYKVRIGIFIRLHDAFVSVLLAVDIWYLFFETGI